MRKPEPGIFHHTLDLLGLEPAECVFVDDLAHNIAAAVEVGMVGVLHTSYDESLAELEVLFDRSAALSGRRLRRGLVARARLRDTMCAAATGRCAHSLRRCDGRPALSPLDVSFLYLEEPTTPMHVGGVVLFQAPEGGFDHDRLVRLIEDRIALVPALPPEGALGAGPHRQPGVGRRRGVRRRLPRAPLGAAAPGHRRAAARPRRPHHGAPARPQPPAVGDVPRRGALGRPVRHPHQDPPRDGRRRRRDRHRPGHPRRHARAAARRRSVDWRPRREPSDVDLRRRAPSPRSLRSPGAAIDARALRRGRRPRDRRALRPSRARPRLGRASPSRGRRRPTRSTHPIGEARRFGMADDAPRRLQGDPAARTAARSTTSCSRWCPARCASG